MARGIALNIEELQIKIKELVGRINEVHKHSNPHFISFMKVVEELGEITKLILSAEIKSRKGEKRRQHEIKAQLGDEFADAIIAIISLANDYDINIETAISRKFEVHDRRN